MTGQSQTAENGTDYNTIKYSPSGAQLWAKTYNGSANLADSAKAVVIDENQNAIVTGVSENGSNSDFHTIKYDPSGNEIWKIDYNGLDNGDDSVMDITLDEFGDIIVAGQCFVEGGFKYVTVKYREADVTDPFGNTTPDNKTGNFTANYGQLTDLNDDAVNQIKYWGSDGNAQVYMAENQMSYTLLKPGVDSLNVDTLCTFNMKPVNSKNDVVYGKEKAPGFSNYYFPHLSRGRERVPSYKSVVYPEVWRNIDLTITRGSSAANYYYVVKPGANLSSLKWILSDASMISVDSNTGELIVETNCGTHRFPEPRAYQISSGGQIINLSWTPQYAVNLNLISFSTGSYNTSLPLVIALDKQGGNYDVDGLCWSTFASGSGEVKGSTIQYDKDERIIGSASVGKGSFVFSDDGETTFQENQYQTCVFKLDNNYDAQWMSFYGGGNNTDITDMVQKDNGEIYCVGSTRAQNIEVVLEDGATSYPYSGDGIGSSFAYDAFVFKYDPEYGTLLWSTYLGDSGSDYGNDFGANIIATADNKIYVSGQASGSGFQHPGSSNSYQGGPSDVFICEFNENDAHTWTYFLGGSGRDRPYGLSGDKNGKIWILGTTVSADFELVNPNSQDPDVFYDSQLSGGSDDFIAQLSPATIDLVYSSYFGGDAFDTGFFTSNRARYDCLSAAGDFLYMAGQTKSSGSTFPIMQDGGNFNYNQNDLGNPSLSSSTANGYIIGLDITSYHQFWGTFLNNAIAGDGSDANNRPFAVHSKFYENDTPNSLIVAGSANHPEAMDNPGNFTYSMPVFDSGDGFVYQFNAGGTSNSLQRSTFIGGANQEVVKDAAYIYPTKLAVAGIVGFESVPGSNPNFPLDDNNGQAMFSPLLLDRGPNAFFAAYCHEDITGIDKIGDANSNDELFVFPNPIYGHNLTVKGKFSGEVNLALFDVTGRLVFSSTVVAEDKLELDFGELSPGTYILSVYSADSIQTAKIIKQ